MSDYVEIETPSGVSKVASPLVQNLVNAGTDKKTKIVKDADASADYFPTENSDAFVSVEGFDLPQNEEHLREIMRLAAKSGNADAFNRMGTYLNSNYDLKHNILERVYEANSRNPINNPTRQTRGSALVGHQNRTIQDQHNQENFTRWFPGTEKLRQQVASGQITQQQADLMTAVYEDFMANTRRNNANRAQERAEGWSNSAGGY